MRPHERLLSRKDHREDFKSTHRPGEHMSKPCLQTHKSLICKTYRKLQPKQGSNQQQQQQQTAVTETEQLENWQRTLTDAARSVCT